MGTDNGCNAANVDQVTEGLALHQVAAAPADKDVTLVQNAEFTASATFV